MITMKKKFKGNIQDFFMQPKQMTKFSLVGVLNTGIDFGVFMLLVRVVMIDSIISNVISYSCGVINSYFFNRAWTFKVKRKLGFAEFIKFAIVNLISLGISTLVLYYFEDVIGIHVYLSKLIAILFSMAVNFIGSKLMVFQA